MIYTSKTVKDDIRPSLMHCRLGFEMPFRK